MSSAETEEKGIIETSDGVVSDNSSIVENSPVVAQSTTEETPTEEKKQPQSISLRPGGGDAAFSFVSLRPGGNSGISLRPGGGEAFSLRPGGSGGVSYTSSPNASNDASRKHPQKTTTSSTRRPVDRNRKRRVYSRETILELKNKNRGPPPPGLMERIQGVYKITEIERRGDGNSRNGSGPSPDLSASSSPSSSSMGSPSNRGSFGSPGGSGSSREKWVPPSMKNGMRFTLDQGELKKQKFADQIRHVTGLLNKVTPENFQQISPLVLKSYEDSAGDKSLLEEHCSLIFEKALSEPAYAFMWGDLCSILSGDASQRESIYVVFRQAVLNKCQDEFVKMKKEFTIPEDQFDRDLLDKRDNGTITEDDQGELEERRLKRKKRQTGTMTFIGELFNKFLLPKRIILYCFEKLLSNDLNTTLPLFERDQNIEAFCKLVTTLANMNWEDRVISCHFDRLAKMLVGEKEIPFRIRFMIEDVLEMRKSGIAKVMSNAPQPMKIGMVHANAVKRSTGKETTSNKPGVSQPAPAPTPSVPTRSEEELASLSTNLIKEFLHSYDVSEGVLCVLEMDAPSYHSKFIETCVEQILESRSWSESLRVFLRLFPRLKSECKFSFRDFSDGITPYFKNLKDIELDYPSAPQMVRDLTSALMESGCLPASFVTDKFQLIDRSYQKLFAPLLGA